MSVITNFPAMPNRIAIVCDYLSYLGAEGASEDSVLAHLSPPMRKTDGDEEGDGKNMSDDVVKEMERLGLICRPDAKKITLTEDVLNLVTPKMSWQDVLRPLLRQRLMSLDTDDKYRQSDFRDAVAWLLVQSPFSPIAFGGGEHAKRIVAQLESGENDVLRKVLSSDAKFQNLLYWARYCGFIELMGTSGSSEAVADPTAAIDEFLPSVFGSDSELPVLVFLNRVAEICPVFEGGSVRRELEARLLPEHQRENHHLSRSTSLALTRLSLRSRLQLVPVSDGESWVLDLGKETKSIGYLRFIGREVIA